MSTKAVDKELLALKARVGMLEAKVSAKVTPGWREAFGALKGEPLHRKAAALGAAWRNKENKRK